MRTILARVGPDQRRVLHLALVVGLNGERLAAALHCTPGNARVRLYRAVAALRAAWTGPDAPPVEGSLP